MLLTIKKAFNITAISKDYIVFYALMCNNKDFELFKKTEYYNDLSLYEKECAKIYHGYLFIPKTNAVIMPISFKFYKHIIENGDIAQKKNYTYNYFQYYRDDYIIKQFKLFSTEELICIYYFYNGIRRSIIRKLLFERNEFIIEKPATPIIKLKDYTILSNPGELEFETYKIPIKDVSIIHDFFKRSFKLCNF